LPPPSANGQTLKKFFTVLPKSRQSLPGPSRPTSSLKGPEPRRKSTGIASGHRTLSEQMEADREQKRLREAASREASAAWSGPTTSRFFAKSTSEKRKREEAEPEIGAASTFTPRQARRLRPTPPSVSQEDPSEKENESPLFVAFPDRVQQEEGYRSPTGTSDIIEVSSPVERLSIVDPNEYQELKPDPYDAAVDDVPSPVARITVAKPSRIAHQLALESPTKQDGLSQDRAILVFSTPESCHPHRGTFAVNLEDGFQPIPDSDEADQSFQTIGGPLTPDQLEDTWEDDKVDFEVDAEPPYLGDSTLNEHPEPLDRGVQEIMAGWRSRWSHLSGSVDRAEQDLSTTSTFLVDDVFGVPGEGEKLGSSLPFRQPSGSSGGTKFKRRRPLVEQVRSDNKAARPVDSASSKSGTRIGKKHVSSFDDSFDDDLPSANLSQRLRDFRYTPA
ncbi:hypothetical protein FRB90_008437, partial [Tulasnella sp. 427]